MTNRTKTEAEMSDSTFIAALQKIAFGRLDNGRSLGGPTSMSIARQALSAVGVDWSAAARKAKDCGPALQITDINTRNELIPLSE